MSQKHEINLKPEWEKYAIDIAWEGICALKEIITKAKGTEEERKKGHVTKTKLSNMLKAAKLAEKRKDYRVFEIAIAYIARDAHEESDLYMFVKNLIEELREFFKNNGINDDIIKIKIAEEVIKASIMIYRGRAAGLLCDKGDKP